MPTHHRPTWSRAAGCLLLCTALAASLRGMGRFPEAAEAAEQVMLSNPAYVEAYLEMGRARIAEGQAFFGIDALKQAKAIAPRDWR